MKSQLSGLLGTNAAKIKSDTIAKSNKEETFFEKGRKLLVSGEANRAWASVHALAKANTEVFMGIMRSQRDPKHLETVAAYRNQFEYSDTKVYNSFVAKFSAANKSPDPKDLMEDNAYEDSFAASLRPQGEKATLETVAWFSILQDKLAQSRRERGYGPGRTYDLAVLKDFQNTYGRPGLFGVPNE